jgi:hypothetical protein
MTRAPLRAHRRWADLITDWQGNHPRELLRNLVNTWVRVKRPLENWKRLLAAAHRALSVHRGRSLVKKVRAMGTTDPSLRWTRLVLYVYTYKHNICLGSFYQRPLLRHGWHPAGESEGAPFFLAIRDTSSGHLLPHHSRITVLAAAANRACAPNYCPGTLEILTTWIFPCPTSSHTKVAHLLVRPIQGFDRHSLQWEL